MLAISSTPSRRHLVISLLLGCAFFALLYISGERETWQRAALNVSSPRVNGLDDQVLARISWLQGQCQSEDPFVKEYGRTNIRMTRAYEGSQYRLREFSKKVLRGERISISTIGGSITKGHQVWGNEVWFVKMLEWLKDFWPNDIEIQNTNGAAPATGSDYFSFCFPLHIPSDSDLILVELAVNDEGIVEHIENMENLLRGLLELPSQPAVVLVEAMAFSNGGMGGGGGRMHLPVAQYYDVPVINQRHPLANHFARYPQLIPAYFAQDFWGNPDMRHLNSRGHRDLGMLVSSLIRDVTCQMIAEGDYGEQHVVETSPMYSTESLDPVLAKSQDNELADYEAEWPPVSHSWRKAPPENEQVGRLMPGMFNTPPELGRIPRLPVLEGWNPNLDHGPPPFHPVCLSTRAHESRFNLTPSTNDGWEYWVHPEHKDKPYLVANRPGARVSFDLRTNFGVIKMYSLRSREFGLGTVRCWVDDQLDKAVDVVGFWDQDTNIGRFATIRTDLSPGQHVLTCEVLHETADPSGGHEFRLISVMSL